MVLGAVPCFADRLTLNPAMTWTNAFFRSSSIWPLFTSFSRYLETEFWSSSFCWSAMVVYSMTRVFGARLFILPSFCLVRSELQYRIVGDVRRYSLSANNFYYHRGGPLYCPRGTLMLPFYMGRDDLIVILVWLPPLISNGGHCHVLSRCWERMYPLGSICPWILWYLLCLILTRIYCLAYRAS